MLSRLPLYLCVLPAALSVPTVVTAVAPDWARSAGVSQWDLNAHRLGLTQEAGRRQHLEAGHDDTWRRIGVKEALVADLIAGRATLDEVTTAFQTLNAKRPDQLASIRTQFAGGSDREKMARNVLAYTYPRVASPAQRERVARRLEAEFDRLIRADGPAAR